MKIREVRIQNFRSFGPELRTVDFVDPLTQQARPLTVLVGSNGCGGAGGALNSATLLLTKVSRTWASNLTIERLLHCRE